VDVVSGGFPCQDISAAGKGAGLDGERSGLWKQMSRIIGEVRPQFALVENSPVLTSRGLGTVLGDLAAMGYDARWGVLGAIDAGAPHKRERIWIVAESRSAGAGSIMGEAGDSLGRASGKHVPTLRQAHGADGSNRTDSTGQSADVGNTSGIGWNEEQTQDNLKRPRLPSEARRSSGANGGSWWASEPNVGRVAHGVASRVDRLRAIGNGQVPAVVRLAWELLKPNK
jgi:DNA (cytosine-5)-methyltransferase 1